MKILVVEDDLSVRETLGMVLESSNHDVVLLENGPKRCATSKRTGPMRCCWTSRFPK